MFAFFFLCEDVKKCPCVIYIYLYTCTHTHSRADLTVYFVVRESLWGWNASTEPAAGLHTLHSQRSDILAIARPFCSSKPYHESLHSSICISRNSDACGFVTWWLWLLFWGRNTRSLISCKPSVVGLELRPHTHYVVYYLNTNTLALVLGTPRYHGKQEKHTCSGGM